MNKGFKGAPFIKDIRSTALQDKTIMIAFFSRLQNFTYFIGALQFCTCYSSFIPDH